MPTGTVYDRLPKNWRVRKPDPTNAVGWLWLTSHTSTWDGDATRALALTKAEAEGFAAFFGAEAVAV